jgi:hypothetical protein
LLKFRELRLTGYYIVWRRDRSRGEAAGYTASIQEAFQQPVRLSPHVLIKERSTPITTLAPSITRELEITRAAAVAPSSMVSFVLLAALDFLVLLAQP